MKLTRLSQDLHYKLVPLHPQKSYTEARQSTRKLTQWPQHKLQ